MVSISVWWMWLVFGIFIALMLFVDLFLLGGGRSHKVSLREALTWTLIWFLLALLFNLLLWLYLDHQFSRTVANLRAMEFFTGYLIEKSLSVDNIFVMLLIFNYFAIPPALQRRVLIYGIMGAIVMRLVLILLGLWLINQFNWILYLFGLFLIYSGFKMLYAREEVPDLAKNNLVRWLSRHIRISKELIGQHFFVIQNNRIVATPLFVALVLIEFTDLIFAVDSIPAIFAITRDPFIVFTSNIFAILGLRALYFVLAELHERFSLLQYGLAIILLFIGTKMVIEPLFHIPTFLALLFVILVLVTSVLLSLFRVSATK